MTISMYQASVPVLIRQLDSMSAFLAKAETHADAEGMDVQALLDGRLAPDMYPLPRQVQIATDMAKGGVARLAGQTAPSYADEEKTIPELRERLARTVAYLQGFAPADIDGTETREIILKAGEQEFRFEGQGYLLDFVLPNVFFHATAAYAILRGRGVPIGKRDFLGGI